MKRTTPSIRPLFIAAMLVMSTPTLANGGKLPPAKPLASNWIQWVMQVVEG